jgi:hypothetical protein
MAVTEAVKVAYAVMIEMVRMPAIAGADLDADPGSRSAGGGQGQHAGGQCSFQKSRFHFLSFLSQALTAKERPHPTFVSPGSFAQKSPGNGQIEAMRLSFSRRARYPKRPWKGWV